MKRPCSISYMGLLVRDVEAGVRAWPTVNERLEVISRIPLPTAAGRGSIFEIRSSDAELLERSVATNSPLIALILFRPR